VDDEQDQDAFLDDYMDDFIEDFLELEEESKDRGGETKGAVELVSLGSDLDSCLRVGDILESVRHDSPPMDVDFMDVVDEFVASFIPSTFSSSVVAQERSSAPRHPVAPHVLVVSRNSKRSGSSNSSSPSAAACPSRIPRRKNKRKAAVMAVQTLLEEAKRGDKKRHKCEAKSNVAKNRERVKGRYVATAEWIPITYASGIQLKAG
jgi:hypothetical protein